MLGATYVIDGQNRRIGKKVNGVTVEGFLYRNQLQPAAWLNGDGTVRARFVYGGNPNVPEYMVTSGGATYRLVTDQLGTVHMVVDTASGLVIERIDWDEFGNVLNDSARGTQPFGFAGGLYDLDIPLIRLGARDYAPEVGRWTAKDPIRFRGGLSNLYGYTGNDPVNFIDPVGLGPGPGPGCSSTIECSCIEGSEAACQELAEVDPQRACEIKARQSSPNQMNQEVRRGKAPREVDRVDRAHPPEDPRDHVHLRDGTRIRKDGTTNPSDARLPRRVVDWLRQHGSPF